MTQVDDLLNDLLKNEPIELSSAKEAWVFDTCRGLADEALSSCQFKHSLLWELDDKWLVVLVSLIVGVSLYLAYRHRTAIATALENGFVNGIAGMIKGKRRVGSRLTDVKNRIVEKANEQ